MKKILIFVTLLLSFSCLKKEGNEIDQIISDKNKIDLDVLFSDIVEYDVDNDVEVNIKEGANTNFKDFVLKYQFTKGNGNFYIDGNKYNSEEFDSDSKWVYKPLTSGEQIINFELYRNDSLKATKSKIISVVNTKVSDFDFSLTKNFDFIENTGEGTFKIDITSVDQNGFDAEYEMSFNVNNSSVGDIIFNDSPVDPGSKVMLTYGANNFKYKVNEKGNYNMILEFYIAVDGVEKSQTLEFEVKLNEPPVINNIDARLLRDKNYVTSPPFLIYKTFIVINLDVSDDNLDKLYIEYQDVENQMKVLYDGGYINKVDVKVGEYRRFYINRTDEIYLGAKPGANGKLKITDLNGNVVEQEFKLSNNLGTK
jgi:hypothetical protein